MEGRENTQEEKSRLRKNKETERMRKEKETAQASLAAASQQTLSMTYRNKGKKHRGRRWRKRIRFI